MGRTLRQHPLQPCQVDLQVLIVSPQGYGQRKGLHGMHGQGAIYINAVEAPEDIL